MFFHPNPSLVLLATLLGTLITTSAQALSTVRLEIEQHRHWSARVDSTAASATIIAGDRTSEGRPRTLYLLTAAHAVPTPAAAVDITATFAAGSSPQLVSGDSFPALQSEQPSARAHLLCRHPRRDLAILWVRPPAAAQFEIATAAPLHDPNELLSAVGFISGRARTSTSPGRPMAFHQRFRREIRATADGPALDKLELGPAVIHSAAIEPGMSGGPLLDSQGRVVGIHVGRLSSNKSQSHEETRSVAELVAAVPDKIRDLCRD